MKHEWKITLFLLCLFLFSQFIGLLIVNSYIDQEATLKTGVVTYKNLPYNVERPDVSPTESIWYIMIAILGGTAILLVLIKFRKFALWKTWFFLSVLVTLSFAFSAFINQIAAFILSLVLGLWKVLKPNVYIHNFTEIFIYGGLAAIFVPVLNVFAASVLLIIISIYDMIAVWQSKHMVKMAEFQTSSNLFSGLFIPKKEQKQVEPKIKRKEPGETTYKISSAVLGGGDMGFPLIFAGVVMKSVGWAAIAIPICAAIGLLGLMILGQKNKFYPAMPFLSAACFIGYAISVYVLPGLF